jgi:GNAT superfamily N-acetyltransferase
MSHEVNVRELDKFGDSELQGLSDVLIDCVEGGASVSFMWPMTRAKALTYWRDAAASAMRCERIVLAAYDAAETIIGTVQVVFAQPENQPHRADVAKMLVHRRGRRRGVGAALLVAAEHHALRSGKTLHVRQGWRLCGRIPDYALMPDGALCATTVYYKSLRGP